MKLQIGDKINYLKVLDIKTVRKEFKTGSIRNVKEVYVKCKCGREKWIRYEHVKAGIVKSCSCLNYEPQCKDPKERACRRILGYIKSSAKLRNLSFDLNLRSIGNLIFSNCFYCDMPPVRVFNEKERPFAENLPACHGIDRIDSKIGYVTGNIVSCCWPCNNMKSNLPVIEFLDKIQAISGRRDKIVKSLKKMGTQT